jgi:DNA-binding transcriptional regulator YdaS (Cro superfamily)
VVRQCREINVVTANHQQIRKQALLQAVHCCGKITYLAKAIGASVARVSNWLNRNDRIPYEYAILIEEKTGISVDRLSPQTTSANQVVRQLRATGGAGTVEVLIDKIIINQHHEAINQTVKIPTADELKRPVIIDQNWQLIAGVQRLLTAKALGQETIAAIILDTRLSLLGLGLKGKHEIPISDRVAVAQKIENQLNQHQKN